MKKCVFFFAVLLLFFAADAQSDANRLPGLDKSPMDMAYYPANFPVLKIQDKANGPLVARAIYSRPQKSNRAVFGDLVEYNKVWRLGANEATEIEFYRDVKIGGKKVVKGKYTLYALVNPEQWTLIVNRETDTWGAFKYDEKKDVARVDVPVKKLPAPVEPFTMTFTKAGAGISLVIAWDDVEVALPIDLKP
ncbi:DUF2911 domain-containing protein [Paraflavisolibacter sp. H34]|uniref:DUF2911 domain-containing protein n=1 Tax=Huijunlia imazamoxiresistens TaxID=3127457 RepID=UPI003019A75B